MQDDKILWQAELARGFSSASDLLAYLNLSSELGSTYAEQVFKTRVPRGFAACMEAGNPNDPLLRQVLAAHDELDVVEGFTADPLDEARYNPIPGLIHKYQGRVLLTVTGVCAINCRYCFRRAFDYAGNNPGTRGWQAALDYIKADSSIHEVIFSGGDPLLAPDSTLKFLMTALEAIPHVHTLRIHTRVPVVLPARVDAGLCALLGRSRFCVVVVLHANHPHELSASVAEACCALKRVGCTLLNQSVLLAGVNHDAHVLILLSQRLWELGVLPYYVHLLDKVAGAAHFEVSSEAAVACLDDVRAFLPGYLVPRLVFEHPGGKNKHPVL